MQAGLESFIQEVNEIVDAEELRRRLIALKEELIQCQNREEEYLRSQKEMSLIFQQTSDELKGMRKVNQDLRARLSRYEDKDALDRNRLFGRQTEKLDDLVGGAASGDDNTDPLCEDADPENAEQSEKQNARQRNAGESAEKKKPGKRKAGRRAEDLSKLPQRSVYDYDPEELDRRYGKGNWRIASWHSSTKKEIIPAILYAKTTYTPVISAGVGHELISILPEEEMLLPGSDATASLAAWIMNNKYVPGIPLSRLEADLERRGTVLSRQTMSNWIIRFSHDRFAMAADHMASLLKASGCTQCDETTLLVIRDGRKAGRKSFMWIHITSGLGTAHPVAVFTYEPDRSTRHLREFYEDYVGEIICDACSAYQTFETENGDTVIICGCWMHAGRRRAEALRVRSAAGLTEEEINAFPEVTALKLIGDIYHEEGKLKDLTAKDRLKKRQQFVKPKVDAYFEFLNTFSLDDPGISDRMRDAIRYSQNQQKYLRRFLKKGDIPLDNGHCERKARSFGIGRNNWMFCTSPKGAEASAIMYTIVETPKSNGADVFFYLKYLLEKTPSSPELSLGKKYLDELMPWSETYRNYEKQQKQEMLDTCLPPSDPEPTGKKLMKYTA